MDPYQSIDTPNSQKQRASPTKCTSTTHREMVEHCKMKSPSLSDGRILIVFFYTSMAICRSILIYPDDAILHYYTQLRFKLHGYKDVSIGFSWEYRKVIESELLTNYKTRETK